MKTAIVGALAILLAAQSAAWAWHWPGRLKRKDKPAATARRKRTARPRPRSGPAWTGPAGLAALVVEARDKPRAKPEDPPRDGQAAPAALAKQQ